MATLITDEEINNIIMKCPYENEDYKDPVSFINKNTGACKYAYVTLVMLGDLYIAGAIVLSHSIRNCGSKVDLVVLVTPDVTLDGKRILGMYFTHVVEIDYVNVPNWRTRKQPHRKYLELVFTKFHIFNLTQYEKVLLIDADALVLKYPDHLFTLDAPAGCFLEDKELIISYDKDGNYVLPKNGELEWYKKYCSTISHGKKIPKHFTDRLKTQFQNSGIGGGLMLLEPKKGELENIIRDVSRGQMKWLVENKFVFPEQQYLALRYSGQWTSINPRFFGLQGFPHWKVLYGLQYGGDKPFCTKSKFDISIRIQYPDFVLWHDFYTEMLKENPELLGSQSLLEANEMNKFFGTAMKRQRSQINRINAENGYKSNEKATKEIIANIFDINIKRVHDKQQQYYYINRDIGYQQYKLSPMFDNIKENDFYEPILKLSQYFSKGNYYETLLDKYSKDNKFDLNSIESQTDKDLIFFEYLKCKKDMFVLTFWPILIDNIDVNEISKACARYGLVCYQKKIKLNKNGLFNLMFWMYDEFTYNHRIDFISKKMEYIKAKDENNVMFLFLENTVGSKISGQGSLAKKEIRNILIELMTHPNKNNLRGNDLVHINDFFYQSVNYGKLILHENSLKVLQEQNIQNIISTQMTQSSLKLQTFKKWITLNLSLLEQERLTVMGSVVLYAYGYKKSNDIDSVYISCIQNANPNEISQSEKNMANKLNMNFGVKHTKIPFVDIGVENSEYWRESWTIKNNEVLNYFKIKDFTELSTDPKNYFYFEGFKCYLLEHEIMRKIFRNRNNDHADFLILSVLFPEKFSNYVEIKNNKISYNVNVGQTGPELEYDYMKELAGMILSRYTKSDITKFKELAKKMNK